MKLIPVTDTVGTVLSHDITEIVPGRYKGAAFKRGHIIQKEDVEKLRDLGKESIAVLELDSSQVHEDEAALRLALAASGEGIILSEPSEGKVDMIAACDGLLKVNVDLLSSVNDNEDIMLATLHKNRLVSIGQIIAGTRIIPLTIEDSILNKVEELCNTHTPIVSIKQIKPKKVGIVTTGNEVYHKESIFDLVVPRILAGERLARKDIVALGHGGMCERCKECRFLSCGFGR